MPTGGRGVLVSTALMTVHVLPTDITSDYLSLRRDVEDPVRLRGHLNQGWKAFQRTFGACLERVRASLARTPGTEARLAPVLARALAVKGEVLFHVDFRCQAYQAFLEAHRLDPQRPEVLSSLIRLELTHLKLQDAALHLFQARHLEESIPDLDLLEEELQQALGEDLEGAFWDRVATLERSVGQDPHRDREHLAELAELAGDYFYDALDPETGEAYIRRCLAAGSRDPEALFTAAEIAFETGDFEVALERLELMGAIAPEDGRARLLGMNVLCRLGREEEALRLLQGAVGQRGKPLQVTVQDLFFQGALQGEEEYHRVWLQLLRRLQVCPDSVGYYYSPGTPETFFQSRLEAARVYHQARLLGIEFQAGDLVEEIHQDFQALLDQAPDYTFLLDEYARFLLLGFPPDSPEAAAAGPLARRAVYLAETSGESEDRFHATLAAADRVHPS